MLDIACLTALAMALIPPFAAWLLDAQTKFSYLSDVAIFMALIGGLAAPVLGVVDGSLRSGTQAGGEEEGVLHANSWPQNEVERWIGDE